jgi:cytochrome c oxidase assembly protein subunit 19
MTTNTLSQKVFQPKPPIQGSFPLDHDGECKEAMLYYMLCLKRNDDSNSKCRVEAKNYLDCRMKRNLMDKEDLKSLGYADVDNKEEIKKTN